MNAKLLLSAVTLMLSALPAIAQENPDRAVRNYQDIVAGRKQPGQLSPIERQEVMEVDRLVRTGHKPDKRTARERCIDDEIKSSGRSVSYLARRVIDLKCGRS